jgi:hypothetical protein
MTLLTDAPSTPFSTADAENLISVSIHDFAEVRRNPITDQQGLYSLRHFQRDEKVAAFDAGILSDEPTYLTIQIGDGKHITLEPSFLQYVNHSCDPNVFFDIHGMKLLALKEIHPGDELRFFYPSTEWNMAQPFQCSCGSPRCIGTIQGARYLPTNRINEYRLSEFIRQKLADGSRA